MKTNEKVCLKCRIKFYSQLPQAKNQTKEMIKALAKKHVACCPYVFQDNITDSVEKVKRWEHNKAAENCPYVLELTVLHEDK
jgi:uncharacterized protein YabN with tetrapyrrole methylase and pyrophosphatase domain